MSFLAEMFAYVRTRRKYWLVPVLVVMALLGGLIVLSQGSIFAPFIYALF
jgi:hypothetical protein